jgi:hypothetical protein
MSSMGIPPQEPGSDQTTGAPVVVISHAGFISLDLTAEEVSGGTAGLTQRLLFGGDVAVEYAAGPAVSLAFSDVVPEAHDAAAAACYEFAKRVRRIPEVSAVTYAAEGHVIRICTCVESRALDVRNAVYDAEFELLEAHPELVFDFNSVAHYPTEARSTPVFEGRGRLVYFRS